MSETKHCADGAGGINSNLAGGAGGAWEFSLRELAQNALDSVLGASLRELFGEFGVDFDGANFGENSAKNGENADKNTPPAAKIICVLEQPKDKNLAHFATPLAFSLAKPLRKPPQLIAQKLTEILSAKLGEKYGANIAVTALNGYTNLRLSNALLQDFANNALKSGAEFASKKFAPNPAQSGENLRENSAPAAPNSNLPHAPDQNSLFVEFISANPTGPLHIGHVRGAVFGDCLVRAGRHLGAQVRAEYYVNDAGNQIALLGTSVSLWARENLLGLAVEYPEKYYRGDYIEPIARAAAAEFGAGIFTDESQNLKLAEFAKDRVLEIIKQDLRDAHIFIDNWASEKSFYPQLEPTLARLKQSGQVYEKDGATLIASTSRGDDNDRVVIRADGRATYLAGDIVYHAAKFAQGFARYVNVWGADHHGYIARMRAAIAFLGYDERRLEVVLMQMVSLLKDGAAFKMSKRAGNAILMSDVLAEIGADALRFIFVSKTHTTALEFDVETLKKQDASNPVFYINYAFARINQVFAKLGQQLEISPKSCGGAGAKSCGENAAVSVPNSNLAGADIARADLTTLGAAAQNLLFEALSLPDVLLGAYQKRELHKIAEYLRTLASEFHKFYNENRVIGSSDEAALLKLFAVVATAIFVGLGVLGIEPKRVMG